MVQQIGFWIMVYLHPGGLGRVLFGGVFSAAGGESGGGGSTDWKEEGDGRVRGAPKFLLVKL